ncbi:TlpA disulfide reductase family protein [Gilvimarinus sp. SDUM040013]|uniref:TlpA disulfide reductase family protein n=1 Tax=Gilvimarinus gilvus TaxID=3058038 RepID=A0ABU4RZ47_9GAMM|nr:TlpA disulfide reductase family protein [Gilvimarinus sp. SDUM040013]MDO3387676.1 TlpA disulfide reductase family protein [Gilvimarinus sp. SDUM040013]MDX6848883.1 TlpA disulfide reductase family protein [Gilvimarinus sp. SDUM040013]
MNSKPFVPVYASEWLNVDTSDYRVFLSGKALLIHSFQMLCPGCVYHSLPQLASVRKVYSEDQLSIVGLHSVFEHHDAMTPTALKAFVSEMGITYPVAIDAASDGPVPKTMAHYNLQGTPSMLIFSADGSLIVQHFGRLSDMQLSAFITQAIWSDNKTIIQRSATQGCSI